MARALGSLTKQFTAAAILRLAEREALTLDVQKMLGHPAVSHGGIVNGFQAYLLYFSEPDIAVAVVTNAWPAAAGGDPKLLALAVAKAALASL